MADVEFFWDPVCPFAWVTSRWVRNVQAQRPLEVDWRFISLRMINDSKDYDADFPPTYKRGHMRGLELLRVAAAAREAGHGDRVGELYIGFGTMVHNARSPETFDDPEGVLAVLRALDLPEALGDAAYTEEFDPVVRADSDAALERCGGNVGTPVLSFTPPDGPSFFGPVISKAPDGDEALRLWDAVTELGSNPWFSELKRSNRPRLEFD